VFPIPQNKKRGPERRLAEIYECLAEAERKTLLDFAEFLAERAGAQAPEVAQQPLEIPRPEEENVVAAMKRLRETYPMIDHSKLLHECSGLMAEHMMQGRPAPEVIDELERLFQKHYEKQTSLDNI